MLNVFGEQWFEVLNSNGERVLNWRDPTKLVKYVISYLPGCSAAKLPNFSALTSMSKRRRPHLMGRHPPQKLCRSDDIDLPESPQRKKMLFVPSYN